MTLMERIAARLGAEQLGFEPGPTEDTLVTVLPGIHGTFVVAARVLEEDQRLVFYAFVPEDTAEDRRDEMMRFVTRANYGMIVGNFELDLGDGEVRFKVSVDLEGVKDISPLVMPQLTSCVAIFDQYLPALGAVQRGTPVAEALAAVERQGTVSP